MQRKGCGFPSRERVVVNARASVLTPLGMNTAAAARAEHISLEGETEIAAPIRPPHRKTKSKYALHSAVRKCSTELALLDDHYLHVESTRARKAPLKYSIDLRYLNSQPVRIRRIAWLWFASALAVALAVVAVVWYATTMGPLGSSRAVMGGAGIALICALAATWLGVRRTSESLNFTTVTGGAIVVSALGGLGSTKQGKAFFVAMIKDIAAAKAARPQPKQQWLRDEMREHHRLRELGVLSEADYEASKARILNAHA